MTRIAILSFPGNNCEVESIRAIKKAGMESIFVKWNDPIDMIGEVDGYFIPGGFNYEDRGRAGMVAGRDPILAHIAEEASLGKVIIGICNGAQVLMESGLIPLDRGLKMSLARNVIGEEAVGFLNEWIWITPTCARDRCATSDWDGVMHAPIAHGEGRFTTKDKDVINELKKNDQIAFSFCDQDGNVSDQPPVCPNGAMLGIAGICNPAGNVVALMPHPERSSEGGKYFSSLKQWIESGRSLASHGETSSRDISTANAQIDVLPQSPRDLEIFIDTIIVNNEERTVEQAARRVEPLLKLKQLKYLSPGKGEPRNILTNFALFNPNKEIAYIRRGSAVRMWDHDEKKEEDYNGDLLEGIALLRRDEPDTGAKTLGKGSKTGVCYVCKGVKDDVLGHSELLEVFANPHASTLEWIG